MPESKKRIFRREIIFVKTPLTGQFQFKDIFQIFPADLKDMPSSKAADHYPVILEYWYQEEEAAKIKVRDIFEGIEDMHRLAVISQNNVELYTSLLSLVSTHFFFKYSSSDHRWAFPILSDDAPDKEVNAWSTKWCLSLYHWPSLPDQLKITGFTKNSSPSIPTLPWAWYYQFKPNFDEELNGTIRIPNLLSVFLECYFATDPQTKRILDSAIASSNIAMEFMNSRKKLSLLSAFTAIETMVSLEYKASKPTKCDKCGQDIFKVSAKYRDFLLKYIGDSAENKRKFNNYYSLRSRIVHTGQDLQTEKLFADVDVDVQHQERLQITEVIVLSKLAIIMWTIKTSTLTQ